MAFTVTGEDLVSRYDYRKVGQLASTDQSSITRESTASNATVTQALSDALGRFLAAMFVGSRYSITDLDGLTDHSLAFAKRLVCDLAMAHLLGLKSGSFVEERRILVEENEKQLKLLQDGRAVFDIDGHVEAGLMEHYQPDSAVIMQRNLRTDYLRGHLFSSE